MTAPAVIFDRVCLKFADKPLLKVLLEREGLKLEEFGVPAYDELNRRVWKDTLPRFARFLQKEKISGQGAAAGHLGRGTAVKDSLNQAMRPVLRRRVQTSLCRVPPWPQWPGGCLPSVAAIRRNP